MIQLFEQLTGRPWTTMRRHTAEYGPMLGAAYRAELGRYTDAQLYTYGDQIVTALREERRSRQCR